MQYNLEKMKNKTIGSARILQEQKPFALMFLVVFLAFSLMAPSVAYSAQKKSKVPPKQKTAPVKKNIIVNDSNILVHQKRVEDLVEKGNFKDAVQIMQKMNDYSKEVLSVTKAIKVQYEAAANDPQAPQNNKEDLFFKLKGLNQLISRYTNYHEASTFNLGYMYSRLGDVEKARKYLVEFLQATPYTGDPDSQWIKAKTLLHELYKLESEF
jgi:tetratricopeptide (TPR) repeat protein